ncbi:MAG: peptidylprolyl isomerase [Methanocellales archaeon]|nr:peptidylprolyl isomerase [Methanocellales archaeon]
MVKRALLLFLVSVILVSGCTDKNSSKETIDSAIVKQGDDVRVDYIGKLEDGTVFDTSVKDVAAEAGIYNPNREYKPIEFTVGTGQMIKGFDNGVVGMTVGESKILIIPPEEAYGPYKEELVRTIQIEEVLQAGITPMVGGKIAMNQGLVATIIDITDTEVVLDFNHMLAGKTLVFKIDLVSIGQDQEV